MSEAIATATIAITNQLSYLVEELKTFNLNFASSRASLNSDHLTNFEFQAFLKVIQDDINSKITEKPNWSQKEVKEIVAQAIWNPDLKY